ncbi:hypothetical protein B0H17DRAFT_1148512 [Mycena rosella]|uniref:Uncharacterized protein n=1 Tax=Mycena rosella TaxID=1033263 RepID=A0AAD7FY16_MYCRO|nr:hypothetical protein B0H17DRAFT_1148512 [Mycena rosella]
MLFAVERDPTASTKQKDHPGIPAVPISLSSPAELPMTRPHAQEEYKEDADNNSEAQTRQAARTRKSDEETERHTKLPSRANTEGRLNRKLAGPRLKPDGGVPDVLKSEARHDKNRVCATSCVPIQMPNSGSASNAPLPLPILSTNTGLGPRIVLLSLASEFEALAKDSVAVTGNLEGVCASASRAGVQVQRDRQDHPGLMSLDVVVNLLGTFAWDEERKLALYETSCGSSPRRLLARPTRQMSLHHTLFDSLRKAAFADTFRVTILAAVAPYTRMFTAAGRVQPLRRRTDDA